MEHDLDDPPQKEEWTDHVWWFANRWAESLARYLKLHGINYADYLRRRK